MATRQSIFEIAGDFRTIRESIMEAGGECSDGIFAALKAVRMTGEEKLTQCYFVMQQWEVEVIAAKEARDLAESHMKRRQKSIESMKARMIDLATELDMKKLDSPHCRFSVCDGKTTLKIDINALPVELIETVVVTTTTDKPKTAEIEKLLKAGEVVDGAKFETGNPYLRFLKPKGDA